MLNLNGYQNNFVWWFGVVEDRQDPLTLGRCRVRIFGFHPIDKNEVPTAELPWATPILPINTASISGVGETPVGPVEGTHVFGFFRDGEEAQFPVMLGTVPGIPEEAPNVSNILESGFQDPGEKYPKDTERHGLNESDVTRLGRQNWTDEEGNEQTESSLPVVVQKKIDNRVKDVPVANSKGFFSEPPTKFDSKYPFNHAVVTESGHIYEMDDTPGKERLHEYHSSGTFTEIYPKGTRVQKVVKDNYEFTLGDNYVNIKKIELDENTSHGGNLYVTIEGDVYEFIQGNVERQINGSVLETIGGNYSTHVNGDRTLTVEGSDASKIKGDSVSEVYNLLEHVLGGQKRYCEGEIVLDSPRGIHLQTAGGNIYMNAISRPSKVGASGTKNGNILMQSANNVNILSRNNIKATAVLGEISLSADDGDISIISKNDMAITSVGALGINSGKTTHVVSDQNIYIGTNQDININSLNINAKVDAQTYISSPQIQTIGNAFGVDAAEYAFISSNGTLFLDASQGVGINSDSIISINSSNALDTSANTTTVTSTGPTNIKGSIVNLN